MLQRTDCPRTASAGVLLAFLAAAGPEGGPDAFEALDGLDAFDQLGLCRDSLLHTAQQRQEHTPMGSVAPAAAVRDSGVLSSIQDEEQRLLLCRLAAAMVTADGRVDPAERQLYELLLNTWKLSHADVAAAIRSQPAR